MLDTKNAGRALLAGQMAGQAFVAVVEPESNTISRARKWLPVVLHRVSKLVCDC